MPSVANSFMSVSEKNYREKVYEIVRQIPEGKVMNYGLIAEILGKGYTARTVGFVMHASDTDDVPWQRVINAKGGCSTAKIIMVENLQQKMLEEEGIEFNEKGFCDLKVYCWYPEGYKEDEDGQMSLFDAA